MVLCIMFILFQIYFVEMTDKGCVVYSQSICWTGFGCGRQNFRIMGYIIIEYLRSPIFKWNWADFVLNIMHLCCCYTDDNRCLLRFKNIITNNQIYSKLLPECAHHLAVALYHKKLSNLLDFSRHTRDTPRDTRRQWEWARVGLDSLRWLDHCAGEREDRESWVMHLTTTYIHSQTHELNKYTVLHCTVCILTLSQAHTQTTSFMFPKTSCSFLPSHFGRVECVRDDRVRWMYLPTEKNVWGNWEKCISILKIDE